jgi:hypothetical protein
LIAAIAADRGRQAEEAPEEDDLPHRAEAEVDKEYRRH